jgi:hypothetical protein
MASDRVSQQAFFGVSALLFAASTVVTIVACASISANGRNADARRLEDVNGVDADARTHVARRHRFVPWHVGRDDNKSHFDHAFFNWSSTLYILAIRQNPFQLDVSAGRQKAPLTLY